MKKIQLILTSVAILAACAGVFANARAAFATTYYRPFDAQFNQTGAICGLAIINPGCPDNGGTQCSAVYQTTIDGQTANRTYFISKIVDSGPCVIVTRPL